MIILAHRGWWTDRADGNSKAALKRAFDGGFGVETDIRDRHGEIVISHNPAPEGDLMSFADFLRLYVEAGRPGVLALNVKADGLQDGVVAGLGDAGVDNAFVFDMSVPDALWYLRTPVATFTRQSEYERSPAFYDQAAGVWMDIFDSDWIGAPDVNLHLKAGKQVALVSPELHRRDHAEAWSHWRGLPASVMLCTDYPDRAAAYFNA